ncbi:hypothetical protein PIB30_011468 [Stylosanthes scabra]|uniref:Uncharacterized protein n=1 Tax=Stylosanthes scabra TaxID=79078 RepID=A0ABU6R5Q0_9FABA|nr:hypothetical protein [Stylosanthes scabra]
MKNTEVMRGILSSLKTRSGWRDNKGNNVGVLVDVVVRGGEDETMINGGSWRGWERCCHHLPKPLSPKCRVLLLMISLVTTTHLTASHRHFDLPCREICYADHFFSSPLTRPTSRLVLCLVVSGCFIGMATIFLRFANRFALLLPLLGMESRLRKE